MNWARMVFKSVLICCMAALLGQTAALAQPGVTGTPQSALTSAQFWRLQYSDSSEADPAVPQLMPVPGSNSNFIASFRQDPYLYFDADGVPGELRVYSDLGFRGKLRPRVDGGYDILRLQDAVVVGAVNTNSQWCLNVINTGNGWCFELSIDQTREPLLSAQLKPDSRVLWVPMRPISSSEEQKDRDVKLQAIAATKTAKIGDLFTGRIYNFEWGQRCYDMRSVDPSNISKANCGSAGSTKMLFKLVASDTAFRWENIGEGGQTAVPYGWRFVPRVYGNSATTTTTMSNSHEIQRSVETTLGVNTKVNVFFVSVESKVSVNAKNMSDELKSSKSTVTRSDYIETQSAFVLDKTNAALLLTDEFRNAVRLLKADVRTIKPASRAYAKFVDDWGTHYSAATTYGLRGSFRFTMNEDDVMKLVENGVKVDVSVKVGAEMDGIGASAKVSTGMDMSNKDKVQSSLSSIAHESDCQGGDTCHNGEPTGKSIVPILLDLRPISELLAPPFYADIETITTLHDGVAQEIADRTLADGDDSPTAQFLKLTAQFITDIPGATSSLIELRQDGRVLKNYGTDPRYAVFVVKVPASGTPNLSSTTSWTLPVGTVFSWMVNGSNLSERCSGVGAFGPSVTGDNTQGPVTQSATFTSYDPTRLVARGPSCNGSLGPIPSFGYWAVDMQKISGGDALNLIR